MNLWQDARLRLAITRLGLEYLAALLLVGLFAINTGNNLLYLVFSVMLGLFLVSGWVSRRAIRDLEIESIEEGNLFARVRGGIKLRLRDRAPGRVRGLELRLGLDRARVEPAFYPGALGGGAERLLVLQARPEGRGPHRLRWLEWGTSHPFGFMEKTWRCGLDQEVLVLPHPRSPLAGPGSAGEPGATRPRAGSASPDGARPFRERDPLSRVHWKRTAQRGTPWVRTFEDEAPAGLRLSLDLRAWGPGPAFERELEWLSGAILRARLQRREIHLRVEARHGVQHHQGYTACWRVLGTAVAEGEALLVPGSALT